jgi:MoaA/NifB/PqqE/SkfB family radical SAM enzyme
LYQLITAPYLDKYVVMRPGAVGAITIPEPHFRELADLPEDDPVPSWLIDAAKRQFELDLTGQPLNPTVLVREPGRFGYARCSYELNLGCNFGCEFCYLGPKPFASLDWPDRAKLLKIMRDAGVLFIQMTGGEPTIDPLFVQTYERAVALGMLVNLSTNGSNLHNPRILETLRRHPPYRIAISVYGATETTYDTVVQRKGMFKRFIKGIDAGVGAGLRIRLNPVISADNGHEVAAMEDLARERGVEFHTYVNMSPTIQGTGEPIVLQSQAHLRKRKRFEGCNAGHTFFHADPHGRASICKVGRDDAIPLVEEGLEGLARLGQIADRLQLRTGGCSGCSLSGTCFTCPPLARLYHESGAPRRNFCQHPEPKGGE